MMSLQNHQPFPGDVGTWVHRSFDIDDMTSHVLTGQLRMQRLVKIMLVKIWRFLLVTIGIAILPAAWLCDAAADVITGIAPRLAPIRWQISFLLLTITVYVTT